MTEHDHGDKSGPQDVAGRLRAQLVESGLSQAQAARQMGLSASVLSQLLAGTYPGDLAAVTAKALAWLNRAERGRGAAPALVAGDDFVETGTAQDILRSLEYVQTMGKPGMTMIAGGPGVGKTQALRRFAAANTNVWIATVNRGAARPFPFLETVCNLFRIATQGEGVPALITKLCDRLAGTRGMLILDECQHLGADALETARGLHEIAEIDLVLVGDLRLSRTVASMSQLDSRVRRPVVVERPTRSDVSAIAGAFGVSGRERCDLLHGIAQLPGALRNVESVLRLAGAAMPDAAVPDTKAILYAIQDLRLAKRRAS